MSNIAKGGGLGMPAIHGGSSLDDKLREILDAQSWGYDYVISDYCISIEEEKETERNHKKAMRKLVKDLKQVFAEEGYMTFKELDAHKPGMCMTGQEFYDRFIKELEEFVDTNRTTQDFTNAVIAAKQAAGISDD